MPEAFEIHIYPGDPAKGHEGWMASVLLGRVRWTSIVAYPNRHSASMRSVLAVSARERGDTHGWSDHVEALEASA